ncbi:DUF2127 domain-containing protein [Streptantibioticus cattleyicolor]|uniref:DUF2127 domain-containing protein n=1 Tax=Streptantibioticus cattleyicolor (strain ATCC 35852 / DSM 46488 / JCM 4925 / NBRC 14057 / NRRL 8057) TaxID=1003195 RepID=F8JJ61_STREN|nr:DUF2127 domain-containing protein [Streptantibioticus cattleyicolor]AEW98843.1 hypothetical protein SCATT_p06500 [Streptantibioticus cattleyicolor NRRL 8057 = DSM 46488]CCB72114.1 conserved membrane protein of unknown function [Streptantibioticus cattleyicolor NRRL 8057 = DSM 46488]
MASDSEPRNPPGAPPRHRRIAYELIGCGLHGHHLAGTGAARVRPEDAPLVREGDGLRWHRCLRCDAWLPLRPPEHPEREFPPGRDEVTVPLRGKPLRDRYVLRLIALDRLVHFLVLGVLAGSVLLFVDDRARLRGPYYRILDAVQHGVGGTGGTSGHGFLGDLDKAFAAHASTLWVIGAVFAGYAVLEGVEAVGLWFAQRWAEYLTFVATVILLVPEVYELTGRVSATKILTLVINIAVVVYLLIAKRLFGLRGGGRAEQAERDRDSGWQALERVLPSGR